MVSECLPAFSKVNLIETKKEELLISFPWLSFHFTSYPFLQVEILS